MKIFLILLGLLCTLPVFSFSFPYLWTAVPLLLIAAIVLLSIRSRDEKTAAVVFFIFLLAFVLHRIIYIIRCGSYNAPCDKDTVVFVEGILSADSSYSESGALVLHLLLKKVGNCYFNTFEDFPGICQIVALSEERAMLCAFSHVRLTGKFSGNLFVCTSVEVLRKGIFSHIREALVLLLEKRLSLNSLGMLLLLGRAEDIPQRITESAGTCGCLHILALSGMHLNFLASSAEKMLGKNKVSKILASALICIFVFIAGPRPSLVRAALMYFFSFLGPEVSVCIAFFLQLLLTPHVMLSRGNAFGYLSVFALISLSSYVQWDLKSFLGTRLGKLTGSSVSILLLSAPFHMLLSSAWYPQAIIASPAAAAVALAAMADNLLILIFGPLSCLMRISTFLSDLLQKLFVFFSSLGCASYPQYLVFLASVFVFALACRIYERL